MELHSEQGGQSAVERQTKSEDWDYRTADTKQITHGIHPYPAKMIPQVARRLIDTYGRKGTLLFDPYCGSGTTLLEGMLAGITAVGTDINPLARLIARVKTTPVSPKLLHKEIERFLCDASCTDSTIPDVTNINYWYSPETQRDLSIIRQRIECIHNAKIADVFRVAFSITARKSSLTRQSEFKLNRIPEADLKSHNPEVFEIMGEALFEVSEAFVELDDALQRDVVSPEVYDFNTVDGVPTKALSQDSVDLVITSPPYGDSRTTVAYGQYSRLSSEWLGYADATRVDNALMGGGRIKEVPKFGLRKLDRVIAGIAKVDECRAREVASFFTDYRTSISNVAATVKPGGYACYVVGNRTVKGYDVPTAESTAAFFKENGFSVVKKHTRNIPNKRMPSVNSPSNIPGRTAKTMTKEQIVICQKAK